MEQHELEEKEAEEGFAAGFRKVSGEKAAELEPVGAADAAKENVNADHDAFVDSLPTRLRSIEGTVSGITRQVSDALATVRAAAAKSGTGAPSDAQNPEAWRQFEEDFPDLAQPIKGELAALRSEIAEAKKTAPPIDVDKLRHFVADDAKSEVRAVARDIVEERHEGWVEMVKTPTFKTWLAAQPADVKALAASERPRDAIKLLDRYQEQAGGEEAFSRGFRKARK